MKQIIVRTFKIYFYLCWSLGQYFQLTKLSTPNYILYSELERYRLDIHVMVKFRMISFWVKQLNGSLYKLMSGQHSIN